MCKFSSKSGGVPFQPLGDLTWNDPAADRRSIAKNQPEPERRQNIGDFTGGRTRELC